MSSALRKLRRRAVRPSGDALLEELELVTMLYQQGSRTRAIELAEEAAEAWPSRPEVLQFLAFVCAEMGDIAGFERHAYHLAELDPDDPDLAFGLTTAHILRGRPAMGVRAADRCLERWPDHPQAAQVRAGMQELREELLPLYLQDLGLGTHGNEDLALQHERVGFLTEIGLFDKAERCARRLLHQAPDFTPGLNNYSQLLGLKGEYSRAIELAERVTIVDAGNIHALANLVRFHCLDGHPARAEPCWAVLAGICVAEPELLLKQAEAASYAGKDAEVLRFVESVRRPEDLGESGVGYLYQLAGAAALRVGREKDARRHWQKAVKASPEATTARENLEDLRRPPAERHAPWAFPAQLLIPASWANVLLDVAAKGAESGNVPDSTLLRVLRELPGLQRLLPFLLERGDPWMRQIALLLTLALDDAQSAALLRDFALDRWGPDGLRRQAAEQGSAMGVLPSGAVRMFLDGQWQEVMVHGYVVHSEVTNDLEPVVARHMERAFHAFNAGQWQQADTALSEAERLAPRAPRVVYGRATLLNLTGRYEEAQALILKAHELDPNYHFARTALAAKAAFDGDLGRARELLQPILDQRRMHFSEFNSMCSAQVQILLAEGSKEAAESWLDLWEDLIPDSQEAKELRKQSGYFRRPTRRRAA